MKKLKDGECRVIRINREAIYETICERFFENKAQYFDLPKKVGTGMLYFDWDEATGDFICCVSKDQHLDYNAIVEKVAAPTTDSLYQRHGYAVLFGNEDDAAGEAEKSSR